MRKQITTGVVAALTLAACSKASQQQRGYGPPPAPVNATPNQVAYGRPTPLICHPNFGCHPYLDGAPVSRGWLSVTSVSDPTRRVAVDRASERALVRERTHDRDAASRGRGGQSRYHQDTLLSALGSYATVRLVLTVAYDDTWS